jgi:hypothetical protein
VSYYKQLYQKHDSPIEEMFGIRVLPNDARLAEASRLTGLMRYIKPFCFLRMGDVELRYLLTCQAGMLDQLTSEDYSDGIISGTIGVGNPGLGPNHAERLWKVYEEADYVDFHERNWPNEYLVQELKLNRRPETARNPDKNTSCILMTWVEKEFKSYCQGRRIGFVGAEARLLELLSKTEEFQKASKNIWPDEAEIFFHQARDDGRNLDANLDLVKEDVRRFVTENKIETLFISLGGGAKIIGFEISRELGICCMDFGAMMRALTYSGSDGNRFARSPHSPFFYRISFETYMNSLETAFSKLTSQQLLAKSHGQFRREMVFSTSVELIV